MRRLFTVLLPLLALVSPAPARATVLVPADLTELARSAVAIVRGTVTTARPEWAEGRRRVETIVVIAVTQTMKGTLGGTVTFKVPGGDMGRYRSFMIGAPSFREGEEVIVFLGGAPPALPYILGLGQGVFRVLRDSRTGESRVTPPPLIADATRNVRVQRGDPARRVLSVEEFAAVVRETLSAAASERKRNPAARPDGRGQ